MTMEIDEAKELLNGCTRSENRDHAFGDAEVFWTKDGVQVAEGYFGNSMQQVMFDHVTIQGTTASELRDCGIEGHIERNDETGPEEYSEGSILPGLTLEGVRNELTAPPKERDLLAEEIDRISNEERMTEAEIWDDYEDHLSLDHDAEEADRQNMG